LGGKKNPVFQRYTGCGGLTRGGGGGGKGAAHKRDAWGSRKKIINCISWVGRSRSPCGGARPAGQGGAGAL